MMTRCGVEFWEAAALRFCLGIVRGRGLSRIFQMPSVGVNEPAGDPDGDAS